MRFSVGILICFIVAFFSATSFITTPVSAHEIRPAFLKITELSGDDGSNLFEASFRQPQVNGSFLGLELVTNCVAETTGESISEGALIQVATLDCASEELSRIAIVGLDRTLIDTLVSISWLDGPITNRLITAQAGSVDLSSERPALPVYLTVGLTHLLFGFDHILFVIMLMYLVRNPTAIVLVISSFTIAHSITLALSALNLVSLSQPPVEAVIAGSIVLLAYEILQNRETLSKRFPALIAFAFGLIHGLGFAGALREIGLPEENQFWALALFNIGIELGQLMIVVLVLTALRLTRLRAGRFLREAPVYLAGGIASFWFMQRSWLILVPVFS
ncbi:MAG: HupE/UreJ family protein [Gammaproteobacteria bacterium]|nr:HupE/UreJ family protein [Gammaproteobacteria bacterium]